MTLPERCIDADNLSDAGHVSERKIIVCLADCIKRRGVQIPVCEGEENENCISSDEDVICYSEQL